MASIAAAAARELPLPALKHTLGELSVVLLPQAQASPTRNDGVGFLVGKLGMSKGISSSSSVL